MDMLISLGIFAAILVAAAGIVYLPYWALMRLLKSSSSFYYHRTCGHRTFSRQRFRSNRQTHGFSPPNIHLQKPSAYEILQCTPNADNETIKKNYRALVKQYHPDHVSAQNKDEKVLEHAKMKMQQINEAYESIKRVRGLKR
jgi:peroxiredoxin family protein